MPDALGGRPAGTMAVAAGLAEMACTCPAGLGAGTSAHTLATRERRGAPASGGRNVAHLPALSLH